MLSIYLHEHIYAACVIMLPYVKLQVIYLNMKSVILFSYPQ